MYLQTLEATGCHRYLEMSLPAGRRRRILRKIRRGHMHMPGTNTRLVQSIADPDAILKEYLSLCSRTYSSKNVSHVYTK